LQIILKQEDFMDKERLQALIDEATVDCYNEDEEFTGVLCTLDEQLNFPLQARALGDLVEVIGLNEAQSSLRRGIMACIRKGGQEYNASLEELEFVDPDPTSAEWLEAYRYWVGTL
jgi:hypothetical protein